MSEDGVSYWETRSYLSLLLGEALVLLHTRSGDGLDPSVFEFLVHVFDMRFEARYINATPLGGTKGGTVDSSKRGFKC